MNRTARAISRSIAALTVLMVFAGLGLAEEKSQSLRSQLTGWRPKIAPAVLSPNLKLGSARLPEGQRGDVRDIYKRVAPSTVLILAGAGYGSGVIVNPEGWILTNNHVIADGERDEFRIRVRVLLGKLGAEGVMEPAGEMLEAYVYKVDRNRDLAVIKLSKPAADLVAVKLAASAPTPGEPVAALGHAAIGLLWAIKAGEISSIGQLTKSFAALKFQEMTPAAAAEWEAMKRELESGNQGLVIQSTCRISSGDSGGPLVNQQAELVGLNAFTVGDEGKFHVHVNEIRDFLKEIPTEPLVALPDPWLALTEAAPEMELRDVDEDGKPDTLIVQGTESASLFLDLDQNAGQEPGGKALDVKDIAAKRNFDAEVIVQDTLYGRHVWYDSDNDGRPELLLMGTGLKSAKSYRLDENNKPTAETKEAGASMLQVRLVPPDTAARFLKVAPKIFDWASVDITGTSVADLNPTKIVAGAETRLVDLDEDGREEARVAETEYEATLFLDLDQAAAAGGQGQLEDELALEKLAAGSSRAWYDQKNSGTYDLVLQGDGATLETAAAAWTIAADGKLATVEGHRGRNLLRPGLFAAEKLASRAAQLLELCFGQAFPASDQGMSSFPAMVPALSMFREINLSEDKAAMALQDESQAAVFFDLDKDSFKGGQSPEDLDQLVESNGFDAEFAWMHSEEREWVSYDTDGRPGFDVVVFTADPGSGLVEAGYRIDESGNVKADAELAGKKLIRPSLLQDEAARKALQSMAGEMFRAEIIGD